MAVGNGIRSAALVTRTRGHRRAASLAGTAVAVLLALAGCGSGPAPPVVTDETRRAAGALCQPIRAWVNEVVDLANATTTDVRGLDDPRARSARLLAGLDAASEATDRYRRSLDELAITGTPDGARAVDDLRQGADRASGVLDDERAQLVAATPDGVADGDLVGRLGGFMISLETAWSAAEPPVVRYDDEAFKRAVLDEPACDHVVQPFSLDS